MQINDVNQADRVFTMSVKEVRGNLIGTHALSPKHRRLTQKLKLAMAKLAQLRHSAPVSRGLIGRGNGTICARSAVSCPSFRAPNYRTHHADTDFSFAPISLFSAMFFWGR